MKTIFISLILLATSCLVNAQHVSSGSLKKIPWGISKDDFLKKLPGKYLREAEQTEDKVIYNVDLAKKSGTMFYVPTLTEEFEYLFYDDKLFGVIIKLSTKRDCKDSDTKKVQKRLTKISETLEELLGQPNKMDESYSKIAISKGSFTDSTFAEWLPKQKRENFPGIYIKIKFNKIELERVLSFEPTKMRSSTEIEGNFGVDEAETTFSLEEIYLNSYFLPLSKAAMFGIEKSVDVNDNNDKVQTP